jgi:ATP-dependent DNA helicase RecG
MAWDPEAPVQYVRGVGPQRARLLEQAGIKTASDLVRYLPFRYEDRSQFRPIHNLEEGQEAVIQARVVVSGDYRTSRKRTQIFEVIARDDSGAISIKFFNQPYLGKVLQNGRTFIFYGTPRYDRYAHGLTLLNPEFELVGGSDQTLHTGRIVPVYRRIGTINTRLLRQILFTLLERLDPDVSDPLPEELRRRLHLPDLRTALTAVHFPAPAPGEDRRQLLEDLEQRRTPAFRRLIFEEFFSFQVGLSLIRRGREVRRKQHRIEVTDALRRKVREMLPFRLTTAQRRVLREIVDDLRRPQPMSRLLQGDVGSGKTIVAVLAAVVVTENGCQTALMAPTELLAEQHYRSITRLFEGTGLRTVLLTGSIRGARRRTILNAIAAGEADLVVGTHALIQEGVQFRRLALAVIDEQHRFGVIQRSRLMGKGDEPDTLVMTATPIPRSLALTVYGDLSVSVLDELPPGRQPIRTVLKRSENRAEVYEEIRRQTAAGRQAYIVYPLVEESEKLDLQAATEAAEFLSTRVFPEFRVGLMHARLKSAEKDALMMRFVRGEVQILVSTTVIEVGIDVPNATIMVIEHAERFGLSQLHQLRGRIGRGRHPGLCVLVADRVGSDDAWKRLDIMRRTQDGFVIAERDLELRGPGEFVGTRQSGLPEFQVGNLVRDRDLLEAARREAEAFVAALPAGGGTAQVNALLADWRRRYGLFTVG